MLYNSAEHPETGCREWLGARVKGRASEYGRLSVRIPEKRRTPIQMLAHRVAWETWNGRPIPDGYTIDHICGNTLCINPEHLQAVPAEENVALYHERRRFEQQKAERFGP